MHSEKFNEIVRCRLKQSEATLVKKDLEYSSDIDRLHNFKKAGQMKGKDPIEALDGMWLKHRVSIEDMLDKMANDTHFLPTERWIEEKLGDNINYTLLFEGLIRDRAHSEKEK